MTNSSTLASLQKDRAVHGGLESPRMVWVSTITPSVTMDEATWIDTTRELGELGWRVTLIGRGEDGIHHVRGVDMLCLSNPRVYFLGQFLFHLRVIMFLLRQWSDVDVVMFHQISAIWLLPLRLLRWIGRRKRPLFIMDTRDLPDPIAGNWRVLLHLRFYKLSHWIANKWADGQITITDRMAALADVPKGQLLGTWPSGVNVESFAVPPESRRWPVNNEPIHLIYIGSMLQKRHPLPLCHAVERANDAGMSFVLSLYGDGAERPALEAFAEGTNGRIRVFAPVPHKEVAQLLANVHVGVTSLPEPDDEKYQASSPVKLFEYMAAGLPMLATSNPCHTEVVGEGAFAFWAHDASEASLQAALAELWQQRDGLPQLSQAAIVESDNWTWAAAAAKLSQSLCQGLERDRLH